MSLYNIRESDITKLVDQFETYYNIVKLCNDYKLLLADLVLMVLLNQI